LLQRGRLTLETPVHETITAPIIELAETQTPTAKRPRLFSPLRAAWRADRAAIAADRVLIYRS
jgi:hypothetical protein